MNCPKHVEFYYKNNLEKLENLAGFIVGIYHDARSPERQIVFTVSSITLAPPGCNMVYLQVRVLPK